MIAIHSKQGSFSDRWIAYCEKKNLPYKLVNCYDNDIVDQLRDCKGLMWHFHHAKAEDYLMAKQLMFAAASGKKTFPDFNTAWHFDDKIAQKYLLEEIMAPLVPSYVFYSKAKALEWASQASFPKVFKLRGGAGSVNVKLVRNQSQARKLIRKAFGKGFSHNSLIPFPEIWGKFRKNKVSFTSLIKSFGRQFKKTYFERVYGKVKGYVYFQDFIPNKGFDVRIVIIGDKALGEKRFVRKNDFRASGSGVFSYDGIDLQPIQIAFDIAEKLKTQSLAFDFIYDKNNNPLIVEISYGFGTEGISKAPGYWDKDLNWHEGPFDPYGWMVENLLKSCEG